MSNFVVTDYMIDKLLQDAQNLDEFRTGNHLINIADKGAVFVGSREHQVDNVALSREILRQGILDILVKAQEDKIIPRTLRQRLDRRIHNQRKSLRENWTIIETRFWWIKTQPLQSKYMNLIRKSLSRNSHVEHVNKLLKSALETIANMRRDQGSFVDIASSCLRQVSELEKEYLSKQSHKEIQQ